MPLTTLIRSKVAEFSHTATVPLRDGQLLKVRVFGTSMGQPVLILSGLGMSASHWLPMIMPFANQYRFYLPDFRGIGQSSKLSFNQTDVFQNHMEDIQDVITYLKLKDILLIGYSLGATTAMHLQRAGQFEVVKRYLHIDQSPCIRNQEDWSYGLLGKQQEELFQLITTVDKMLAQHPTAKYLVNIPFAQRSEIVSQIQHIRAKLNGETQIKSWHKPIILGLLPLSNQFPLARMDHIRAYLAAYTGAGHDYRSSLKNSTTPITQIVGMGSTLYHPKGQMQIADLAAEVKIVRFEQSGHAPFITEPRKFVRTIGQFLTDQ